MDENTRKWIVIAVLVASVAGIGALYVSNNSAAPAGSKGTDRKAAKKDKKEAPSSPKQAPAAAAAEPEAAARKIDESAAAKKKDEAQAASTPAAPAPAPAAAEPPTALTPKQKAALAVQLKDQGNDLYKKSKFQEAIECYSKAIDLQPTSAVFWCNRAACHANLNDPKSVVEDCTKALALDPAYVKALHRRAIAYEQLGQLRDALNDFTTITILDGYKNPNAMNAAERLLKTLAETQALAMLPNKKPMLPSATFVSAYLEAFRPAPCPALEGKTPEPDTPEFYLAAALAHIKAKEYELADEAITKAVSLVTEENLVAAHVYNLQGTFLFLKGQVEEASAAFERSLALDATNVNTLIKMSNILMERGEVDQTLQMFERALQVNDQDPDIYYHRGQVKFLSNDFGGCILDYQKSLDLDPTFPAAYIQLGVSQYKLGSIQTAMGTFKKAMAEFPTTADIYNYYGELLMDQGRFPEAVEQYDKCINLAPVSPMAYINKATLMFQVFQDAPQAERLLRTALEKDPRCDLVYVQLANFLLPQGKVDEAIKYFDKAIDLARTLPELVNAIMAKENVLAQYHVTQALPASLIAETLK
ncbi:TOM (translocase of outer membrane) complex component [Allomyces arbusculus]|nr:TOM (translocase of outer membrane) complex component [Allomyces arbusculus]